MAFEPVDITDSFTWEEGLPRPQWDLLTNWVETRVEPADHAAAWTDIARQWLEKLGPELGSNYHLDETEQVLLLSALPEDYTLGLLRFAHYCHKEIPARLPGVAQFGKPEKHVLIALHDRSTYYQYVSPFYGEGNHGGSGGIRIRQWFPHVAMQAGVLLTSESTLAHELTHAALDHLQLPLWIEEGLTQHMQRSLTGNKNALLLGPKEADEHRRFWARHGLSDFWRGKCFHQPSKFQRLSYSLAEILMKLLSEAYQPGWFGLTNRRRHLFFAFLREARRKDCGEAAAREHLQCGLSDIAALFLGQGDWSVGL